MVDENLSDSIRMTAEGVERWTRLVGELTQTRDQLLAVAESADASDLSESASQLDRITSDLQQELTQLRRQPLRQAWSHLPRLVKELSHVAGKPIELNLRGGDAEADLAIIDALRNPLMHLVRNAVEHGLETPDVRRDAGKPEAGSLMLSADLEKNHVVLTLADDGAGVPHQRVVDQALQRGLITEAKSIHLSETELVRLIFRSGFSTAEQVASDSGRGFGLDVVRTDIERIGGAITLTSTPGRGTQVRIRIPLNGELAFAEEEPDQEPPPSGQHRILVIDDSPFFRQLIRTALETDGYHAVAVDSAEKAMERLSRAESFEVILCDIEMPRVDGCQFAAWCRERPDTRNIPLIAITSLDADVHGPRILAAGFDRMLVKFQPQELRATMVEMLCTRAA